jgi:hypothetical protein
VFVHGDRIIIKSQRDNINYPVSCDLFEVQNPRPYGFGTSQQECTLVHIGTWIKRTGEVTLRAQPSVYKQYILDEQEWAKATVKPKRNLPDWW